MSKYLLLYRVDPSAGVPESTPEQQEASLQTWMAWFGRTGEALVDAGAPVMGGDGTVGGYSIVDVADEAALAPVLDDHPHAAYGTIDVLPFVAIPGA